MADTQHQFPPQVQEYPGYTEAMVPHPQDEMREYQGSGLLKGKKALITGGDSGIGRAVAIAFAKEGADVAIAYLEEHSDAERTLDLIEEAGRRCLLLPGDLADEAHCRDVVDNVARDFHQIDVLVNHAGTQFPADFEEITTDHLRRTFEVNVFAPIWVTQAALPHMREGGSIIMTASVNGLRGNANMIDYAASKGANLAMTYALSAALVDRKIRVNAVAPGPVWTPLIPATFTADHVERFGGNVPMGRAAQPDEIAPSYVFFASEKLSSYYTGEVLAPIGGEVHPG
jgi:NAD(P)-dependent dehydrogenase (short-subunit alcohol dehydrogenase family)